MHEETALHRVGHSRNGLNMILVDEPWQREDPENEAEYYLRRDLLGFVDTMLRSSDEEEQHDTDLLPWGRTTILNAAYKLRRETRMLQEQFNIQPKMNDIDGIYPQEAIKLLATDERHFLELCKQHNIKLPESERKRIITVNIIRSTPYNKHQVHLIDILRNREVFGICKYHPLRPNYHYGQARRPWKG